MAGENFEHDDQPKAKREKPLKFDRPEKSDLEKIEEFITRPLAEIEKFIKDETVKRGLKKVSYDSPEANAFRSLVDYKIKSLNASLSENERDALRMSKKYNKPLENQIAMVMYSDGAVTFGWKLEYVNGVTTIVPFDSFM